MVSSASPFASPPSSASGGGGGATGSSYTPRVAQGRSGPQPPSMSPQAPFLFKTHASRWQVIEGRLLPLPGKLLLQPGVNAVELHGDGVSAVDTQARVIAERKGWSVIPVDCIPPAHKEKYQASTYLWTPNGRPDVVLSLYEKAYPGSPRTQCDLAGWIECLEFWVESGRVPVCPDYIIERMIDERQTSIDGHIDKVATPSVAAHVNRLTEEIAVLREVLDGRTREVARGASVSVGAPSEGGNGE